MSRVVIFQKQHVKMAIKNTRTTGHFEACPLAIQAALLAWAEAMKLQIHKRCQTTTCQTNEQFILWGTISISTINRKLSLLISWHCSSKFFHHNGIIYFSKWTPTITPLLRINQGTCLIMATQRVPVQTLRHYIWPPTRRHWLRHQGK